VLFHTPHPHSLSPRRGRNDSPLRKGMEDYRTARARSSEDPKPSSIRSPLPGERVRVRGMGIDRFIFTGQFQMEEATSQEPGILQFLSPERHLEVGLGRSGPAEIGSLPRSREAWGETN